MKQTRLFGLLLQPSLFSLCATSLLSLLTLLGLNWSSFRSQAFFTTYLSGRYGLNSIVHDINAALGKTFDSTLAYNIAVLCFAALVGLGVYAVLESLRHMLNEAVDTLEEVEYAGGNSKQAVKRELEIRIGLRALSALVWIGYSFIFFDGLLPLCTWLSTKGLSDLSSLSPLKSLGAFLILLVGYHIHVVFIRLIVLRPRAFGNSVAVSRGGH